MSSSAVEGDEECEAGRAEEPVEAEEGEQAAECIERPETASGVAEACGVRRCEELVPAIAPAALPVKKQETARA